MSKYKLIDICKIEKGKIGITKATGGNYPLVTTAAERGSHDKPHFNEAATIVPLVSSTGHGHASIKRLHFQDGEYAVGSILAVLTPIDKKFLNAKYLHIYLSAYKEELLVSQMKGAANVSLTLTRLGEVEIDVPDMTKQLHLIEIFDLYNDFADRSMKKFTTRQRLFDILKMRVIDKGISGELTKEWRIENDDLETGAELLLRIKKSTKDEKVEETNSVSKHEIPFKVPETWEWCRIKNISEPMINKNIHNDLKNDIVINYIDIDSIDSKRHKISEPKKSFVKDLSSRARRIVAKGDVLYSLVRPYLHNIAVVEEQLPNQIGTTGFYVIRPVCVNPNYLLYYLLSSYILHKHKDALKGFNSPSINVKYFEKELVPLPPFEEQAEIVRVIEQIFGKIETLEESDKEAMRASKNLIPTLLNERLN